ncbi:hypothetical protein GYMLUDRAFT_61976 [Collybiopsis luxurians FD-317 M1]|uniref:FAS1 domain-containing protein n=1 Tax=Collybiopsis luxurians FD-317 M1 TaxID=944289 RepID=A0A0D0BNL3_9AGAR|nr:hypothetical protein GYMLUDRAFT_61976 [Collybiopsis luxurians FD-317 M1]
MRLQSLAILAALTSLSYAQNLTAFADALGSIGATNFTAIAANLNSTSEGQAVIQTLLSGRNFTIFAPNNDAHVLSYHILQGNFSSSNSSTPELVSGNSPDHTIGRSLLNSSEFVTLEGNASQVLAWTKENGAISLLNQPNNVSVINSTRVAGTGIDIYLINGVLSFPPTLSTLVSNSSNTTSLSGLLNSTMIPAADGTNQTLATVLDMQKGMTAFAPTNDAFSAISSSLSALAGNQTAVITVLQNHIINGTSVYSTEITNGASMTSAAGESLKFSTNSSGTYVTSGSTTAKIVQTDLLTSNGVVHLIDAVLLNLDTDPSAASSAYQSATSAAATMTETGPIAASATGPNGSSSTSSGGSNNGAGTLPITVHYYTMSFAAVIGFVVFGAYTV